jgi:tRNA dimethylallyltransferase
LREEGDVSEPHHTKGAILIAGPTASGKSALSLALAERLGGEIVNADSMQVYRALRVLTARPSAEDEARAPHHLYGVLEGAAHCSAGKWSRMALETIRAIEGRGHVPIVVGGTGLYFRALTEGLSPIPAIPDDVREAVRAEVAAAGEGAHALLVAADPALAEVIRPSDKQRIARGIEVARGTAKPLSQWHKEPPNPLLTGRMATIVLAPEREWLRARCDLRFERMLEEGALDEVRDLAAEGLDPALPLMKALGLRPLADYVAGKIELSDAVAKGQAETRAYAKRQETWFRTQMIAWERVSEQDSEWLKAEIFSFIDELGLTGG